MSRTLKEKIRAMENLRNKEYVKYLNTMYEVNSNYWLTTEKKEKLVSKAYMEYKEIEKETEEMEILTEIEELAKDRPIPVQL